MLLLGFFSLNPSDFFSELICWTNSFWNVLLLWLLWLHPLLVFPLFSWLIFLSLLWGLLCSTLNHCIPRAPSIIPFITLHILPGCSHPLIASTTIFIPMTLWSIPTGHNFILTWKAVYLSHYQWWAPDWVPSFWVPSIFPFELLTLESNQRQIKWTSNPN